MSKNYPIVVNDEVINSSEALYQACRYPNLPDVQWKIIRQKSPKGAKLISREYASSTRSDWDDLKVLIMKWCLRVKLIQNWNDFSGLLLQTGTKRIVEESKNDDFWGAISYGNELVGTNVLGRLLMELREQLRNNPNGSSDVISPLRIKKFKFLGKKICSVSAYDKEKIFGRQDRLID